MKIQKGNLVEDENLKGGFDPGSGFIMKSSFLQEKVEPSSFFVCWDEKWRQKSGRVGLLLKKGGENDSFYATADSLSCVGVISCLSWLYRLPRHSSSSRRIRNLQLHLFRRVFMQEPRKRCPAVQEDSETEEARLLFQPFGGIWILGKCPLWPFGFEGRVRHFLPQ